MNGRFVRTCLVLFPLVFSGCGAKVESPEQVPAVDLGPAGQGGEPGEMPLAKPERRIETH